MNMTTPSSLIESTAKAQEVIDKNGNTFHYKVIKFFRDRGWEVLISPYYADAITDKPREIDIIAEKAFEIRDFADMYKGAVNVRLFVECKYIKGIKGEKDDGDASVFWFDVRDAEKSEELSCRESRLGQADLIGPTARHHYFTDSPVAKLFATGITPTQENQVVYKAVNQCLHSLISYRYKSSIISRASKGYLFTTLRTLNYPLIVTNSLDNLFSVDANSATLAPTPITQPFQIEVNYISREGNPEYFLVDVAGLNELEALLAAIEQNDLSLIKAKVGWER